MNAISCPRCDLRSTAITFGSRNIWLGLTRYGFLAIGVHGLSFTFIVRVYGKVSFAFHASLCGVQAFKFVIKNFFGLTLISIP